MTDTNLINSKSLLMLNTLENSMDNQEGKIKTKKLKTLRRSKSHNYLLDKIPSNHCLKKDNSKKDILIK